MGKKRDRWSSDDEDESEGDAKAEAEVANSPDVVSRASSLVNSCRLQPVHPVDADGASAAASADASIEGCGGRTEEQAERQRPPPGFRYHNPLLRGCRSVYDSYERLSHLDEGTYGVVWKARDNSTGEVVAIKQIKFDEDMTKEGFPISALREIGVLLSLRHECIVTVREMVVGSAHDKVFMVMECMEMDLQAAMAKGGGPFAQSEVKFMMRQLISAVAHVHERWFLHRDVKSSNVLVHKTGRIALCDFGLARKFELPLRKMTQMVVTLWYRSPELLFGEAKYGPEVDMWSIGCMFGEFLIKDAILKGTGELDQIQKIFKLLGTPRKETWPEFYSLPSAGTFKWKNKDGSELGRRFRANAFSSAGQTPLDADGFDLLTRLLTLNPKDRISAKEALDHPYFRNGVKIQIPSFFS